MTLRQEAYSLLEKQPDSNIQLIIDLLRAMTPSKDMPKQTSTSSSFRRTGLSNGTILFPDGFDEHFDDLNSEIADSFYGGI